MQFFRSCFRERGSPNGEDFYPQTRRFPAAILGGSQGEATQYTDKKTAQAVCNAYENGFSGRNEMKEKGWRPFWAALLAALLVLLPLVGGTVLLTRRSLLTRLAPGSERRRHPSAEGREPPESAGLHRPHRDDSTRLSAALPECQSELHPCAGSARRADRTFGADETALSDHVQLRTSEHRSMYSYVL